MRTNPDQFDVEALERSLNQSGGSVSTIWVSFLLFGLYLAIAAGSVTDLQLLLNAPIKLPLLDANLPLDGFFFVAPVLFVIFHVYVLVQVVLLCRTAAAYNEVVEHAVVVAAERARIRQRLANTLFAQIFAGSPRERAGLVGVLLRFMARVTLAIGPVLLLLLYQVVFLPYQDHATTFVHRVLILLDLAMVLFLWRPIIDSRRGIRWLVISKRYVAWFIAVVVVLFSWLVLAFPGEPHANWMRPTANECGDFWIPPIFADRLKLSRRQVVDDEKLAKIESAGRIKGLSAHQGERTRDFSKRNFRCADFYRADLRRADFTWTNLQGANLAYAQLQGATLSGANLSNADLWGAQLQGADLSLVRDRPYGALRYFAAANLRDARLVNARLQGARVAWAHMDGADLSGAQMQGVSLYSARIAGANLSGAQLQGADLGSVNMQGANLSGAQMQGANLTKAHMEGARLDESSLTLAEIRHAYLWRTQGANCHDAQVTESRLDLTLQSRANTRRVRWEPWWKGPIIEYYQDSRVEEFKATPAAEASFIEALVRTVPEAAKQVVRKRFIADARIDYATKEAWRACEAKAMARDDYERKHADYLIELACKTRPDQKYLAYGIYSNWIEELDELLVLSSGPLSKGHVTAVVRGLLGSDGNGCFGARELGERIIERLRELDRLYQKN